MPPSQSLPRRIPSLFRATPNPQPKYQHRHYSSKPTQPQPPNSTPPPPSSSPSPSSPSQPPSRNLTRLTRLNAHLPRIVQRWTTPLLRAPASQILAFLLLHEATAVIPVLGLVGVMHYTRWMPPFAESKWVVAGVEKFGRYARRKGWLEEGDVVAAEGRVVRGRMGNGDRGLEKEEKDKKKRWWQGRLGIRKMWQKRDTLWGRGEDGVRLLVEVATAWAVVKALIIPRLALSVWATPWFARIAVEPIMRVLARRGSKLVSGSKRKIS